MVPYYPETHLLRADSAAQTFADDAGEAEERANDSEVEMSSRKRISSQALEPDDDDWFVPGPRKVLKVEKTFVPQLDKHEHMDKNTGLTTVTVMIGLPGLQPGNVTIDLLHNKLTISGQSIDPPLGEGMYFIRELQRGKFSRVVAVPLGMRLEDFKARMENGLLTVTFPKDPPEQKPHRIPIESTRLKLANS